MNNWETLLREKCKEVMCSTHPEYESARMSPTANGNVAREQIAKEYYEMKLKLDLLKPGAVFPAHDDPVNHPKHYTAHPSGVECIQITEHMGFCLGNAIKYIWRADLKHDAIEDLEKAAWYLRREIERRKQK